MQNFNFILQPYSGSSTKIKCPSCGKKTFTRYIYAATGEIIADYVGRCDRENNCGYHYAPKQFFTDNPDAEKNKVPGILGKKEPVQKPVQYLPLDIMLKSVQAHKKSCLFPFLDKLFRYDIAGHLCEHLFIGANKAGNTVFWQADSGGYIRQAKVMQYNLGDGHRNKEFTTHFVGRRLLNDNDAHLQQCFFGEYQLSLSENDKKTVGIVEFLGSNTF